MLEYWAVRSSGDKCQHCSAWQYGYTGPSAIHLCVTRRVVAAEWPTAGPALWPRAGEHALRACSCMLPVMLRGKAGADAARPPQQPASRGIIATARGGGMWAACRHRTCTLQATSSTAYNGQMLNVIMRS